jgi:hypothetical protein
MPDSDAPAFKPKDTTVKAPDTIGSGDQPASLSGFVDAELSLIKSLPQNFGQAFQQNLKDNWGNLAIEAGVGLVVGAGIAALTKNPALAGRAVAKVLGHENPILLGEQMARFVKPTIQTASWSMGSLALVDAGTRLGAPAWDLMKHPGNFAQDQALFAGNVASMTQDYTVMGATGFAGARFAFNRTAPYINRGPLVDATPAKVWAKSATPEQLNKAARFTNGDKFEIAEEKYLADDVYSLYNSRFPIAEQQPRDSYEQMIKDGYNTVITYRDKQTGELAAAHILGFHEQPNPDGVQTFAQWLRGEMPAPLRSLHGDFVFVRPDLARQGLGSQFYSKVLDLLQTKGRAEGSPYVGLTGEMEDPHEPAEAVVAALKGRFTALPKDAETDPMHTAESIWRQFKAQNPDYKIAAEPPPGLPEEQQAAWQSQQDKALAQKLLAMLGDRGTAAGNSGDTALSELGEAFRTLDERVSRRNFYWGLTDANTGDAMPKVNSGINWQIQDFEDPTYRGRAQWTAIPFDPARMMNRELGYAFMTDLAGYGLNPNGKQVLEFMRNNNYYRGSSTGAYTAGAFTGAFSSYKDRAQW